MYRRFKCENCSNIFISKAEGRSLMCINGQKPGCKSTLVNFIEEVELKKKQQKTIKNNEIQEKTINENQENTIKNNKKQ